MDKNLIHIDDLIRQRLNGEEKERAGAWLHMRDLLDNTMPTSVVPVAVWSWRKTMLTVAVVAGICTLGIGGYEMSSAFRGQGGGGSTTGVAEPQASVTATEQPANSNSGQPTESATTAIAADNSDNTPDNTTTTNNTPAIVKNDVQLKPTNTPSVTKPNNRSNNITPSSATNTVANNTKNNVQQPLNNTTSSASNTSSPSPKNNTNNGNTGSSPIAGVNNTPDNFRKAGNEKISAVRTVPSVLVVNRPVFDARGNVIMTQKISTGSPIVIKNDDDQVVANNNTGNAPNVNMSNAVPQASFIGPQPDETVTTTARNIVPASRGNGGGDANSGNKGGIKLFGWVDQLLESVSQYQFGKVGVNTGLVAGGNFSLGKYNLYGFQGGFFADFIFHEKWSVRAEAKYMQRFNKIDNVYSDNYFTYSPNGSMFNKETNEHYFKYSTVSGFDIPLVLQYTANNFFVFGGANFAYFQAIQTEEINHQSTNAIVANVEKSRVPLKVTDFNSRFGGGYLLGFGFTKDMWSVDARMVHNVWDNAKSAGAQQISRDIYYKPMFQVTGSFRFGKDKRSNELTPGKN